MVETLATGAVKFIVRYGSSPLVGAKVYTSVNRITWYYWGYTNSVGVLIAQFVPAGLNYWMVSATGYNTASGTVNVIANSGVQVDVYMTKSLSVVSTDMVGSLTVTSNPEGALVYINDSIQELPTPVTIADLPEGDYVLDLTKDEYGLTTLVKIMRGQTAMITVSLTL